MLNTKDTNHLVFIYNRLKNVHGENENYDYMLKLKEIINHVENNNIVNKDQGWDCPDSPTHYCDYTQEDGSYDEDCCRYCGKPEERK